MTATAVVNRRGVRRWNGGHLWIYRSDVVEEPAAAGVVRVVDERGRFRGTALFSPASEIRLRRLTVKEVLIDTAWWQARLAEAAGRREAEALDTTAYRVVHGEGDGLPSLVIDRYGPYLTVQLLSAGLEAVRGDVLDAIRAVLQPSALVLRNDASVRRHEGLPLVVETVGTIPEVVEVREGTIRFPVSPTGGQKTGAFLDQRDNRRLIGAVARGRSLDVFCYQGLFALHMAARAHSVLGVDVSAAALGVARQSAALNAVTNVEWVEANAFDVLRELERDRERFDTIVLDPPAFVKQKDALRRGLAGYKEINLRALKLLRPGGRLLTCSCSFHVDRARFLGMLEAAAGDSGRRVVLERVVGQASDHPEVVTIPETGYLKGALLRVD